MKNALFVFSIIFLAASGIFYFSVSKFRDSNKSYWGDLVATDTGIWLSRENEKVVSFKIKEDVHGYFSGYDETNPEDYLMNLRLTDPVDKTDFKVSIPRLYNKDNIELTPAEIVNSLTNPGTAVISIITDSSTGSKEYLQSIFLPPTQ